MNHIILARNNDECTAERIREFADGDHLNAIKPEARASWLDNIGLQARWMVWSAETNQKAQAIAEDARSAPNGFTIVHVVHDSTGHPLTPEVLSRIVASLPTSH